VIDTMTKGPVLHRDLVDSQFPGDLPEVAHWESRYPPRGLPDGARVTRFGPSPTGFVHISAAPRQSEALS
jgi:glutamyl-tRNA synthetase